MFCQFEPIDSQSSSDPEDLTQVITSLDLENGSFTFVDKIDIIASFGIPGKPSEQIEEITDLFLIFGQLYGIHMLSPAFGYHEHLSESMSLVIKEIKAKKTKVV